jgi:hypothetical protein
MHTVENRVVIYNTWLMMSYNSASVYEPDPPERKSGMVKNPVESVSSTLPLEQTCNIYKNSAGNSIIKCP